MSAAAKVSVPLPVANRWWKPALAVCLIAYYLIFNWGSLRVRFAADDLSNIGHYYEYSPGQLVLSNLLPWRGDSRPMGGLYYIPVYHFAGLNPVPYQAVLLAILLANVFWAYRFAVLLDAGELAAWLLALACCYHAGIANLYYNAAFVFDALCCFFYLASMVYYLRIRRTGRLLHPLQIVVFLGLVLCALNSKEMAVSLGVMTLIYELLYHRPKWGSAELGAWVRGPALPSLLAGCLTLLSIYGKVSGPQAMITAEGYHPVFNLQRLFDFHVALLQDLFFSWAWKPGWAEIAGAWAILAVLAWRPGGRPVLRFLFFYLAIVPLPIEFLPGKREACFVLLMVGGGLFLAVVFSDVVLGLARYVAREFHLPAVGYRLMAGAMVAAMVYFWMQDQRHFRADIGKAPMTTLGWESWDIIEQLRASTFHPRPGSLVAFLDDPFHSLDMYFLARLWFHDRSVTVHVSSQGPLTAAELAKMHYIFTFDNRKLIRVK